MMRDAGPKVRRLLHLLSLDRLTGANSETTHSTQGDWVPPDTSNHCELTRVRTCRGYFSSSFLSPEMVRPGRCS